MDHIELERPANGPDIYVRITEKKASSSKLKDDCMKIRSTAARYFMRPFSVYYEEGAETPDLAVMLRGCIPELEVFLNFLTACAEIEVLEKHAREVYCTLERVLHSGIGSEGRNSLLKASLETLRYKAGWLAGVLTQTTTCTETSARVRPPGQKKDREEWILRELGVPPPEDARYRAVLLAVGTMDETQRNATAKALRLAHDRPQFRECRMVGVICTRDSSATAEELRRELEERWQQEHQLEVFKVLQEWKGDLSDDIEKVCDESMNPVALIVTMYPRSLIDRLVDWCHGARLDGDLFCAEVISISTRCRKTLEDTHSIVHYVGPMNDFWSGSNR